MFSAGLTVLAQTSPVTNVLGEAPKNDFGHAIAVDSATNIIIAGTTESYGAGLDDVFIAKYSPSKVLLWNVTWGSSGSDQGYGVAVDSADNVIVTGQTNSYGAGGTDALIVKYSSAGVQLWNRTWGGSNFESGSGVTVDSENNAIIIGYTNSSGAGLDDVFIVKYSSSGSPIWSTTFGGKNNDRGYGVAVDSLDNIVLTGYTDRTGTGVYEPIVVKYYPFNEQQWSLNLTGVGNFGHDISVDSENNIVATGWKYSSTSGWDAFVAKCHYSGNLLWNRTWGGSGDDRGYGVTFDSADNIVMAGTTQSFGAGGVDEFVATYSKAGGLLWNSTWGGSADDYGFDVTVDSKNDPLVTGYTNSYGSSSGFYNAFILSISAAPLWQNTWGKSTTDRGQAVIVDSNNNAIVAGYTDSQGAGLLDAVVVKYSSTGSQLWNRTWGGGNNDRGYGVAVDSTDNIMVTGYTGSYGVRGNDAFIAEYSPSGLQLWNRTWGGTNDDQGYDVAVDSTDNILLAGYTSSFGAGRYDAFIAKYSPSGVQLWNRTWGESYNDYAYGVALDSLNNIIIVGKTQPLLGSDSYALAVKYSSSGSQLWNHTWTIGQSNYACDVTTDSADNIIITGQTSTYEGISQAFVSKYSPSDNGSQEPQWSHIWGGGPSDRGWGVAVDAAENIVMTGEQTITGNIDAFVVKYSSQGVQLWSRLWDGGQSDYGRAVAVDSANNIVLAGTTESFSAGSSGDVFIVKYPSSGYQTWHILWAKHQVGDVDWDGDVDASDLLLFSNAYGSLAGESKWNSNCDFNNDDKVDVLDLFELGKNFAKAV